MSEPGITLRARHDSGGGNLPVVRYVVHCTAGGRGYPRESAPGTARATARYFQNPASKGSAHYVHDASGAEEHCVPENVVAWHAPPNPHSIGDEICGEATYTRAQWLSDQVWPAVRASALRCREVCDRHGIPKVKRTADELRAGARGICGHADVSAAWGQSSHWDPGPGFPWDRYMAVVTGQDEEDDMPLTSEDIEKIADAVWLRRITHGVGGQGAPATLVVGDIYAHARQAATAAATAAAKAMAAAGDIDEQALARELAPLLAPQVITALGEAKGISPDDVEAALRKVLREGVGDDPA